MTVSHFCRPKAGTTTLLWIPGHHRIAGNEEAEAFAKQAAAITDGAPKPVTFTTVCALIRRTRIAEV